MVNACVPDFFNELLISKCFFNIVVVVFENPFLLLFFRYFIEDLSFEIWKTHILTQSTSLFLAINSISIVMRIIIYFKNFVLENFNRICLNQNFAILVHIWVLRGILPNPAYTAKLIFVDFKWTPKIRLQLNTVPKFHNCQYTKIGSTVVENNFVSVLTGVFSIIEKLLNKPW